MTNTKTFNTSQCHFQTVYIEHPLIKSESIERRDYQVNIAQSCLKGSTLVVLPTGMGKTTIALLVIAEKLSSGKILFLAPTKPLAEQHYKYLESYIINQKNSLLTGEVAPKKRLKIWNDSNIVVSTPQVIKNDLIAGRINLNDVALIIFDEAHRAVGNYSYVFIAQKHSNLVLGMTASPGSNTDQILEVCKNLKITNIELRSEYDEDVKPYVHPIAIAWVAVELPENLKLIIKELNEVLAERIAELRSFGLLKPKGKISTKELLEAQIQIQRRIKARLPKAPESLFFAAVVQSAAVKINHAIELGETQGLESLRNYFERLENDRSKGAKLLLNDPRVKKAIMLAKETEVEHPKLREVVTVVKEQLSRKKDARIIVFTHYRDTSELVMKELNQLPNIKAVRFIGQATKEKDKGLSQKEQAEIIEKFKRNECNVLVATAVGEEGLDIPQTDLVVFYEPIPSEIRTIQRRGRTGRARAGKVVILITKKTRDEAYYWSSKKKEKSMRLEIQRLRYELARAKSEEVKKAQKESKFEKPTGQLTLAKFTEEQKLKIIVDTRELNSGVARELSLLNINIASAQLETSDYIISDRIAVERKTAEDFVRSLIEGRLFSQLKLLKNTYPKAILVLEGEPLATGRKISENAILGALASIVTDFNIPIIQTKSERETALLLSSILKREFEEGRAPSIRGSKPAMSLRERQQFITEGLPNISTILAQRLLAHFGSVKAIVDAEIGELMQVEGIGKKTAEEIVTVLRAKYLSNEDEAKH
ncbi:MAG: DEAD/DEAH box helicase [Candidatus Thermoplasmatota archaeon]|nr:DEAD/DEAH box helicase [Candidatus Thermoplasmatota archaeon]